MKAMHPMVAVWGLLFDLSANQAVCADVLNMGGTRNADGSWTGIASLETVLVGDPGNLGEWPSGDALGTERYCGSVGYVYRIGKYEVTAGQYCEFLNKVAGVDTYGLYHPGMSSVPPFSCGIERFAGDGTIANPYQYRVAADYANRPVNHISFWDACRFANWLHNGQPSGPQGPGTTETGTYTLDGYTGYDGPTIVRNTGWKWAVTSEDEWHKAAYYKGGSTNAGYWDYPTRSDTGPGRDLADVSGNNANYYKTSPSPWPIQSPYYLTMAGEFQNSPSPYGTFDQGGNVREWNDTIYRRISSIAYTFRGLRGGSFINKNGNPTDFDYLIYLLGSKRWGETPNWELPDMGFRVVLAFMPGDVNVDGFVNVGDLQALAAAWGAVKVDPGNSGNPSAHWNANTDFNTDNFVNVGDLQILVAHWGESR